MSAPTLPPYLLCVEASVRVGRGVNALWCVVAQGELGALIDEAMRCVRSPGWNGSAIAVVPRRGAVGKTCRGLPVWSVRRVGGRVVIEDAQPYLSNEPKNR